MYLSELELQGFKSFAQKTKVKFDDGITAIVGPNGCGKSNIVDALRWSLGEQRPSLLRSANMTNVIFNGTAKRKSLGMAEVSLTIINNRGVLPTEFTDVTITRRLYRSGESEYLLNKAPCRLKDIVDLFMDTGMGSNAYSVIELKMVEEILNDKNNDRRKLFEEASGITKYKERKKQTLRKLASTHADLQRVEDILFEVRKKTRSLQAQASKAERAQQYEKELKNLDLAVSKFEYNRYKEELEPLKEKVLNAAKEKETLTLKLEELEQAEDKANQQLFEKERIENQTQKEVSAITYQIQQLQTDIKIHTERITSEQNTIRQYEEDIVDAEKEIKNLRRDGKDAEMMLLEADKQLAEKKEELDEAQKAYQSVAEKVSAIQAQIQETNQKYQSITKQLSDLQNKRIRYETQIQNADEQRLTIAADKERIQKSQDTFSDEVPDFEVELQKILLEQEEAEEKLDSGRKLREELRSNQDKLKDEIRRFTSKIESLNSEITLLNNIANSNEAFPESVKFAKKEKGLSALSDIFSTSEEYAVALESVLGDAVNYLIVENRNEAGNLTDLLKQQKKGKITVIPLDVLSENYEVANESLYHQVRSDDKFDALKKLLLGSVIVAENLDEAWKKFQPGNTVVTRDGDVISAQGFLKSGSKQGNEGLRVGLKEKIEKLRFDSEKMEVQLEDAREDLAKVQEEFESIDLTALNSAVKDADAKFNKLESRKSAHDTQSRMYNERLQELAARSEKLEVTVQTAKEEMEALRPQAQSLETELEEVLRNQIELKSQATELNESRDRAQSRYNDMKLKYQQLTNEADNLKRDKNRAEEGIETVKARLQQRAENAKLGKDKIIQNRELIDEFNEKLNEAQLKKVEADQNLEQAKEASAKQRGRIHQIETESRNARRNKDTNSDLLHSLDKQKTEIEMESKRYSDHIWEEYGLLMDQIDVDFPEDTDISSAKETIYTLKQRLKNIGQVNPLAIEEYEKEKERLDHHEEQINDLRDAEEQLQKTIKEINDTAQERFLTTFEQIRINFKTVFNTLFEENDHCDLMLQKNEEDPLESKIEIIANPRGKRPSVIEQLSGGEKTLTAIALLFAIYLVKPSPFCILDEVDAPLDDANIERFAKLLRQFSKETQFIVITHNKNTMEKAEMMYGVTMPEPGVSKLVGVRLDEISS